MNKQPPHPREVWERAHTRLSLNRVRYLTSHLRVNMPMTPPPPQRRLLATRQQPNKRARPTQCECAGCKKPFQHNGARKIHERTCHSLRIECKICGKSFGSRQGVYGHQSSGACWRAATEGDPDSSRSRGAARSSSAPAATLWNKKIDCSWEPIVEIEHIQLIPPRQTPSGTSVQTDGDGLLDISQAYFNLRGWRVIANSKRYMTWSKLYISPDGAACYGSKTAATRSGYVGSLMRNVPDRERLCPLYVLLRTRGTLKHTVMQSEDAEWQGVQLPRDFSEATQLIVAALNKITFSLDTRGIKHSMPDGGLRITLGLSAAYNRHGQNTGVSKFQISAETKARPELTRLVASLINLGLKKLKKLGAFVFTSIQINKNNLVPPHVDILSHGNAYVLTLGEFTGGGIWFQGEANFNDARQGLVFDSRRYHATEPYMGSCRYCVVAYTSKRLPLSNLKHSWGMLAYLRNELRFRVPSLNSIQNATILGESPAPTKVTKVNQVAAELEYDIALRGRSKKKMKDDKV